MASSSLPIALDNAKEACPATSPARLRYSQRNKEHSSVDPNSNEFHVHGISLATVTEGDLGSLTFSIYSAIAFTLNQVFTPATNSRLQF